MHFSFALSILFFVIHYPFYYVTAHQERLSYGLLHTFDEVQERRKLLTNYPVIDHRDTVHLPPFMDPLLPTNFSMFITPSIVYQDVGNITVSWSGFTNANSSTDFLVSICANYPLADYFEFVDIDNEQGNAVFTVFHTTCNLQFRMYRGKPPLWPTGIIIGNSSIVQFASNTTTGNYSTGIPYQVHIAYSGNNEGNNDGSTDGFTSMTVSWTTALEGLAYLYIGTSPSNYTYNISAQESITYNAGDLCTEPANLTNIDYWQFPGYFHHARLTSLQFSTRYFVLPVMVYDGTTVVQGQETTFITARNPFVNPYPYTFAAFGDVWVSGGDGAVGTAERLRERIANDATTTEGNNSRLEFLLVNGDHGYAKGSVFLWDYYMGQMNVAPGVDFHSKNTKTDASLSSSSSSFSYPRIPMMVGVGNHEYDYPSTCGTQCSQHDPSGVQQSWHPTWWDGLVDSLGECGVGTAVRFRSPSNGNQIFWYSFETGPLHVIVLSSEHDSSPGSPQRDWLDEDFLRVNRTVTPFLIVTQHRPLYQFQQEEPEVNEGFRTLLEPRFLANNVNVVMNGHIHSYLRTCEIIGNYTCAESTSSQQGITYIVNGAAGAVFSGGGIDPKYSNLVESFSNTQYGITYFTAVNSTHLYGTWVLNIDGSIADEFWIVRKEEW